MTWEQMLAVWIDTYKKNGFQKKKNEGNKIDVKSPEKVQVNTKKKSSKNVKQKKDKTKLVVDEYIYIYVLQ